MGLEREKGQSRQSVPENEMTVEGRTWKKRETEDLILASRLCWIICFIVRLGRWYSRECLLELGTRNTETLVRKFVRKDLCGALEMGELR